jgi:myo-inositol-1(or 4)-monophosphatase
MCPAVMISLHEREAIARRLAVVAREAAAVVMQGWRSGVAVELKGEIDLVTRFDRASEDLLRARIRDELPGCDLVAEEGGGDVSGERPVVYADPLDGTTNFAHGHPFFCVSIALTQGTEVLAGAIVAPALGVEYIASHGGGVTRNGAPCRVSGTDALARSLLATGFPYDNHTNRDNNLREFAALTVQSRGVRRCGSAALDLCFVADGAYDGYWERKLGPWDIAAGTLCVVEAGGVCTDFRGDNVDFRDGALVASNRLVHHEFLGALERARTEPPFIL